MKKIRHDIRNLRFDLNLSLSVMAKKLRLTKGQYKAIEIGDTKLSNINKKEELHNRLKQLAKEYNIEWEPNENEQDRYNRSKKNPLSKRIKKYKINEICTIYESGELNDYPSKRGKLCYDCPEEMYEKCLDFAAKQDWNGWDIIFNN